MSFSDNINIRTQQIAVSLAFDALVNRPANTKEKVIMSSENNILS